MGKAAVPCYLGEDFRDCPPGHRFTLYGAFWETAWRRVKNVDPKCDLGPYSEPLPAGAATLRDALISRQRRMAATAGDRVHTVSATSIAPFVTGTGIEHPLENGMAFLIPYGLPYLPGSSVKGVLRRGAEELADGVWGDSGGWDRERIDALFGPESERGETDHTRGALTFWDVFPGCERLAVDIMNPHYGDYYQRGATPHDAGRLIPIYFLVLPPATPFTFHVQCDRVRLPASPDLDWKGLLDAAFDHAFDWLGFGAKTAVGYGQLRRVSEEERRARQARAEAEALRCPWVDETIAHLVRERQANNEDEALRGRRLAEAWAALEDLALKQRALADIRARWQQKGWWDQPPGRAARRARDTYQAGDA